jgi:hypothetical protein
MLTRFLLLEPSSSGFGRADCRNLNNNAITELTATLFNTLTNLKYLCVTLDAAMHAPLPSRLCGGDVLGVCRKLSSRVHPFPAVCGWGLEGMFPCQPRGGLGASELLGGGLHVHVDPFSPS